MSMSFHYMTTVFYQILCTKNEVHCLQYLVTFVLCVAFKFRDHVTVFLYIDLLKGELLYC